MKDSKTVQTSENGGILGFLMPHNTDLAINIAVLVLAVFGLIMISSASMGLAIDAGASYLPKTVAKQVVFLTAGYYFMRRLAKKFRLSWLSNQLFGLAGFGMLGLLFVTLAFPAAGGAHAWIMLPIPFIDVSIQPSEFAKIMVILIAAAYCGDVRKKAHVKGKIYGRAFFFAFSYFAVVLLLQHDFGSMAVMLLIFFVCMEIPSHPQLRALQNIAAVLFFLGIAGVILIMSPKGMGIIEKLPFLQEYQINRFKSAINPFIDQYDTGFQLISGLISFASGGWRGLGYGNSVRKYTRFPAANTDFILAIVVEELGLVGFLIVFIPYMVIILRLFHFAGKMKSERGRIILVGTAMYIVIHCLFNIGGVTGLIPLTGVPLLMISSGGSSTLAIMCCIGIAQAVIKEFQEGHIK